MIGPPPRGWGRRGAALGLALLAAACAGAPTAPPPAPPPPAPIALAGIELVGVATLPPLVLRGATLGGLSGVAWAGDDLYLAVSDDKAEHGPARAYRLRVRLAGGAPRGLAVDVDGWTELRGPGGAPLGADAADLEGIARQADGGLFVSSEGSARDGVGPFVARFDADGAWRGELPLPGGLQPAAGAGVRHNLALESLSLSRDGRHLFTATENALVQDGPASDSGAASPCRLLRYDVAAGRWDGQFVYLTDPPHARPLLAGGLRVAGLVDLAAIDATRLLALERSFAAGAGFGIRLYRVTLLGAEDVSARSTLQGAPLRPARKRLLLDLGTLGIRLDNLEGIALGPDLPDGRISLLVVGDDNFRPEDQVTLVLLLALPRAIVEAKD